MSLNVKRDNRLEIIRIIAILMVILSHIANRYLYSFSSVTSVSSIFLIFFNSILRISVPIFFMISGIVNIPKQFDKKKYFARVIRMIVILVLWTLIYYYLYDYKLVDLAQSMFSYFKNHLWYMYALIGLSIASPFISKMVLNFDEYEEKLFFFLWILFAGVYYLFKTLVAGQYNINTTVKHPIPIINAAYYLGYYVVGYLIYKNFDKIVLKINKLFLSIIALFSCLLNGTLTLYASMRKGSYFKEFYGYQNILIILPSIVFIIMCISLIKDKEYRCIKHICPYIFGIYLSHIIVLDQLFKYINISNIIIGCIVYTVLSFVISYIFVFIVKKIPYINKYIC